MEKRELEVSFREELGKGGARRLREGNMVPAVFYGPHIKEPVSCSVKSTDITKLLQAGGNVLITFKSGDSKLSGKTAFIKDEQYHPLSGRVTHVDLYEVRMDEEIKVSVKIILTGKAKGLGEGGILQQVSRELPIRCLPDKVPVSISVDVSELGIGDSIHVSDITLPESVKVVGQINYTLAAVVAPEEEVVATPAPGEPGLVGEAGAAPAAGAAAPGAPGAAPAAGAAPAKEGEKKAEGKKPEAKKPEGK